MSAPWSFSEPAAPGEETYPNEPTPEGRLLGAELSRLVDVAEKKALERFPDHHPRCDDCALRAGTTPNGCPETLMDVVKAVMEAVPFYCHKGMRDGEPRHLCAGYALLIHEEYIP